MGRAATAEAKAAIKNVRRRFVVGDQLK